MFFRSQRRNGKKATPNREAEKQRGRQRRQFRRLLLEALEPRQMMTGVPEIAVWYQQDDDYGGSAWTELYDGDGNVPFHDTAIGTPVSKTFSIHNLGDAELTLDVQSLVLPGGFTLFAPPDAGVAPCGSTNFTIQFDAAAAGSFSGYFSLGNNDSDENRLIFILAPWPRLTAMAAGASPETTMAATSTVETPTEAAGMVAIPTVERRTVKIPTAPMPMAANTMTMRSPQTMKPLRSRTTPAMDPL